MLISVVGTQITDNLSDNYGVSLVTTTTVFSIVLAIVFAIWFGFERTLSIHTIYTTRREASTGSPCCSRSRSERRRGT